MFPLLIAGIVFFSGFTGHNVIKLTILFNNVAYDNNLTTAWGFSCLIQTPEKTILLDTGGDGDILLSNMRKLAIDPREITSVVLSHIDGDHTGGLWSFLEENNNVTVYLPESFPERFKNEMKEAGARVVPVYKPTEIYKDVYSSGEMGVSIKEQSLVLRTGKGLIVVTGCAHPGIVAMVRHVKDWLKDRIYLVLGGFHLMGHSDDQVKRVIKELKKMGVEKIAPSHCTGQSAIYLFRKAWGKDFIDGGCGAMLSIPGKVKD